MPGLAPNSLRECSYFFFEAFFAAFLATFLAAFLATFLAAFLATVLVFAGDFFLALAMLSTLLWCERTRAC